MIFCLHICITQVHCINCRTYCRYLVGTHLMLRKCTFVKGIIIPKYNRTTIWVLLLTVHKNVNSLCVRSIDLLINFYKLYVYIFSVYDERFDSEVVDHVAEVEKAFDFVNKVCFD